MHLFRVPERREQENRQKQAILREGFPESTEQSQIPKGPVKPYGYRSGQCIPITYLFNSTILT